MSIPSPAPGGGVFTGLDPWGRPSTVTYYGPPGSTAPVAFFNVNDYYQEIDQTAHDKMIQRAINAAQAAGGGRVYLPAGVYNITASLIVSADNVEIVGDGWATQLIPAAGFAAVPVIWVQGPGGANYRYGFRLAHLNMLGGDQANPIAVQLDSTYHARLERVRMQHFAGNAVFLNGTASAYGAYTRFTQCEWENGGAGTAVKTTNHEWGHFDGGHISWYNLAGGIGLNLTSGNYRIIGLSTDECDTAILINNCKLVSILGCGFDRGITRHIRLQGAQYCVIVGNRFHDFAGIGSKAMIDIDSATNAGNVIANNTCLPGSAWSWFIHESGALGTIPNTYANNDTAAHAIAVQTPATGGGIIRGNRGVNPAGSQTPPAVPATTVALTNPFNYDCTVHITGGTVTVIAVGGVATGLTAGSFRVPAGQSIAITYSVQPSWTWFAD